MSDVNDFYIQRAKKIGWLAVAVAICLAIATVFLSGKPAWFAWGVVTGLVVTGLVVTGLVVTGAAFLRGRDVKRPLTKRRWYKLGAVVSFLSIFATIISAILNVTVPNLGWSFVGAIVGFGLVITSLISPLFDSSKTMPK
jgi:amino acid transporter